MASRLQSLTVRPWKGSLNTSDNAAFLAMDEVVIANNVIYEPSSKTRKSRGAFRFFDYIGVGVTRSSSGTTRTIIVTPTSGQTFTAGDRVSIWHSDSNNLNYDTKSVELTSATLGGGNYTLVYTANGSLTEASTSDTTLFVGKYVNENMIGFYDFYYFSAGSKQQARIGVSSAGKIYQYSSGGAKTELTVDASVSWATPVTSVSFAKHGNMLIMAFSGSNVMLKWSGSGEVEKVINTDYAGNDVTSSNPVPDLKAIRVHQNRLFGLDKDDPDKVHWSGIDNPEQWNGEADSGALLLPEEDADTQGTTGLSYTFKGELVVSRQNQTYRIVGEAPLMAVVKMTDSIGCVDHAAWFQVDTEDCGFVSRKGIHGLAATAKFGALEGTYWSDKIQASFNQLDTNALSFIKSVYIPSLNTAFISVRESGESHNNTLFGVSFDPKDQVNPLKWSKFLSVTDENMKITCLSKFILNGQDKLVYGTNGGRILQYNENFNKDLVNEDINFRVKTGILYVDNNPGMIKGFKYAGLIYKTERDSILINGQFKVDNFSGQGFSISQSPQADLLGSSFTLGTSSLGAQKIILPEYYNVDGYGYGCSIDIETSSSIELHGFLIAYEPAGDQQEVIRN
jgi:hypothetical protein